MALKKSEQYSSLWQSCDKLRGTLPWVKWLRLPTGNRLQWDRMFA